MDRLVTMRIHNITPDYIRKIRSRGLGNLSIDDLVPLEDSRHSGVIQEADRQRPVVATFRGFRLR